MKKSTIVSYYQSSQWLYRFYCYNEETLGMHFGLWDKSTKNRQDAILNENQRVIQKTGIRRTMRVLDAGCGVGGTALYIARETGARVYGISLDPKQIALARQYATKRHLTPLVDFSAQDYCKTRFPNNFFDVVYAIESVCHANSKLTFLKEAHRILKPEGILHILDGYVARKPATHEERSFVRDFCWAFAVPDLLTPHRMTSLMNKAGFIRIKRTDLTHRVYPTVVDFRRTFHIGIQLVCRIAKFIPREPFRAIYRNYLAMRSVERGYALKIASYDELYAQKQK